MNNLHYLRELCKAGRKELAFLINATVYTYHGYEQGRLVLPEETIWLIANIYGIDKNDILCEEEDISERTKQVLAQLSVLTKEQRWQYFIKNLTGKEKEKISYQEIEEIKSEIRHKLATNTLK